MNSHEQAEKMQQVAEFLKSRPPFELSYEVDRFTGWFHADKEKFLAAVNAIGPGRDEPSLINSNWVTFVPDGCPWYSICVDYAHVDDPT